MSSNTSLYETINRNCSQKLRPNAGHGLWLCCLLPLAYMTNVWKHTVEFQYKISTIIAFGLFLQSLFIYFRLASTKKLKINIRFIISLLPSAVTSFLIWICLKQESIFSIFAGYTATLLYHYTFSYILKQMPYSYTLGEATIIAQGFVLFVCNAYFRFADYANHLPESNIAQMTTILQLSLVGAGIIIGITHFVKYFQSIAFYVLTLTIVGLVLAFPITSTHETTFMILWHFVFGNMKRICMTSIWLGFLGATSAGIALHISKQTVTTTRTRKYFHILIVFVFVPGLLWQCTFLFIASGLLLAGFFMLETARLIQLPPVYESLTVAVHTFIDEKDAGNVALTPMYLLAGCSVPLWLHPCSCDLTDSAGFEILPLLSGVMSIGIGDTLASVIGSKFGRHKWKNGDKSIEGTVASIFGQLAVMPILIYFGYLRAHTHNVVIFKAAVIINALVEAKTDQVDNLVLPLLTFCILSL